MNDQFDKNLTNRIKEVFDNYEHPPADEAWLKLREKFPAEQAPANFNWLRWSSVAAILLVILGIGLWMSNNEKPVKQIADKSVIKQQPVKPDTTHLQKDNNATDNMALAIPVTVDKNALLLQNKSFVSPSTQEPQISKINKLQTVAANTGKSADPTLDSSVMGANQIKNKPVTNLLPEYNAAIVKDKAQEPKTQSNSPTTTAYSGDSANNIIKQPSAETVASLFSDEDKTIKKAESQKTDQKKVVFSVYAATYFNYAEGSNNQINTGAGFTSDIRLSKNLKLSTGVALAQNSFRYNNAPPSNSSLAYSAAPAIKSQGLFSAAVTVPVFKDYNASLVGIDIPLNIKYEFNPEKNDTYISAGLSSGTFIDERYTYSYVYNNTKGAVIQTEDETSHQNFNSFYFGKTLNFAFGVGYPLGKSNRIIIEPFFKYPLDGLGSEQIRFGSGGLNLKLNFSSSKKQR
ncbi:autotransporter outer membrane beta-barrel domain-containing protein [Mucilaginibacter segetis]|uniref:Autotransporter outer membrane beta-barrel domain-containing protein n=1 Tax=Mucilaginibacter segetis TaxID=2793071 RepID=A0A934PRG9_9SPHI|nr:autotransporter outer membrane beta-barrel domain-containing protein [Mucilaginibacter segetis]MBK0378287.1 autotransporter outer membrane beta-barrel domain-containing protein [Mucilaginibacter segetis]